jgi:hypothetical protein
MYRLSPTPKRSMRSHTENRRVRGFQSRHWGWWYLSIGLGYLLLAIVNSLQGARLAGVILRIVVALGFAMLAGIQFRYGR